MSRRAIGPTRRGWTIAGAALGLLAGGRVLAADELSVLGVAGLVVLAAATVWVAVPRPGLEVRRRWAPARLHVDDAARVDLVVTATAATGLVDLVETIDHGRLRARFLLAPLARGDDAEPAYRLPTERRGPLVLGPTVAVRTDPLGLARRRRVVAASESVLVRPRVHRIDAPGIGAGRRQSADPFEATRAPAADAGGEFLAVRPYEIGDDPRRVHWRSSARADDLMVRQFVAPRRGHTLVVLDTRSAEPGNDGTDGLDELDQLDAADRPLDPAFERAVEAVASVVTALTRAGRPFECVTTAGTVLAGMGADPQRVLDRLAAVMPDEPDLLDAVARSRRPLPPELVVLVSGRADARVGAARRLLARRLPSVLVVTGGDVVATGAGPVVDARTTPFPDAWQAAQPASRPGRRAHHVGGTGPGLTVVR